MSNNLYKGGYTAEAVASGKADHGDPSTLTYGRDQILQGIDREESAKWSPPRCHRSEKVHEAVKRFEAAEAREFAAKYDSGVEGLKAVHDRFGRALSIPERRELLRGMAQTRGRYRRPDGRSWEKLRAVKTIVAEDGTKAKVQTCPKVIFHDAVMDGPVLSLMLVKAASAGPEMLALARAFNAAAVPAEVDLVERITGMEVVDDPYHPKPLGGHGQFHLVGVDKDGKKLKSWSDQVHLGRKLLGALMLRDAGYHGKELDALTGVSDSEAGLRDAATRRGGLDRCIDLQMQRARKAVREKLLAEQRFTQLLQFRDAAKAEYDAYLERRRRVIAGALADLAREAEEKEALKLENERLSAQLVQADKLVESSNKTLGKVKDDLTALSAATGLEPKDVLKVVGVKMKALAAENAALKTNAVFVVHEGQRWTLTQVKDALERLAVGEERGTDEFLLDHNSGVHPHILRQLETFEKHPDYEVSIDALAAGRAAKVRNERWLEIGKKEAREDVRKTEKKRPPEEGDEWKE